MIATRSKHCHELLATLALVLAVVVPVAHGQTVAVSNTGQVVNGSFNIGNEASRRAQGFVTGPNQRGYTLTSIRLRFNRGNTAPNDLTVQLWSASGTIQGN